ncbi:MAG TPA: polysaccharide pyruvyl transferase family protein [Bacteroidetes bacterium]|nr:polysaccharide pyruvyl transferase family protein [Bacteroidota bacterium]
MKDKKKKKTLVMTGSNFSWNSGTMALSVCAINSLLELDKSLFFYKSSVELANDQKKFLEYFNKQTLRCFGFNKRKLPMPMAAVLLLPYLFWYYLKADLIIENPGETTCDSWLFSQYARFILARILRKKFVIYAVSVGPFQSNLARYLAKQIYNKSTLVLLREPVSAQYLSDLGVKEWPITADHAFLLEEARLNYSIKETVEGFGNFIGISVKRQYTENNPAYRETFQSFIEYLVRTEQKNVLLIPHGVTDLDLSQTIANSINSNRLKVFDLSFQPHILKSIIGMADIFVGSRIHACISAWSMKIPTIVCIPKKDHRAAGMSQMLNMSEYHIDPGEMTTNELISLFSKINKEKDTIQTNLAKTSQALKNKSAKNAEAITKLIHEKC